MLIGRGKEIGWISIGAEISIVIGPFDHLDDLGRASVIRHLFVTDTDVSGRSSRHCRMNERKKRNRNKEG